MTPAHESQRNSYVVLILALAWTGMVTGGESNPEQPVQLRLPATRIQGLSQPKGAKRSVLGGEAAGQLYLELDPALLQRVLLQPGNLTEAALRLNVSVTKPPENATLQLFCALKSLADHADHALIEGTDFDAKPLAECAIPKELAEDGSVNISGLAELLRSAAADGAEVRLLLRVTGAAAPLSVAGSGDKNEPSFALTLRPCAHAELFDNDVKPQPGVYTRLRDGHLDYGGRRLRLWGVVGYPHPDRLVKMGFNAQRVWNPTPLFTKTEAGFYSEESIKRGEAVSYTRGDGSKLDLWDKHFADLKAHGLFVMFAALQNGMLTAGNEMAAFNPIEPVLADDSFIAPGHDPASDPADWEEWKKAMRTPKLNLAKLVMVDERLQAIRKRGAKNLLTHVNLYTGKAYGEDECIAVYEVFNENGFAKYALEGGYEQWPPYFQASLKRRWNEWLKKEYADDAALTAAWGKADSGETLKEAAINPGPTLAKRGAYPPARGEDFVRFILDLVNGYDHDFRDYCRTLAPAGVGVNVAPFSFDTQYRPSLPWNFTNSRGEVNCFGMYFWDLNTSLAKPPSAYVIDNSTVEGSATILYETNQARPNPCRTEYPLRLAALAGWQDWDGVFWHYWGPAGESDEAYLMGAVPYMTVDHYWMAVHHEHDPVMCSAMAIAGRMFLHGAIHPAPQPVIAEAGARALFGLEAYGGAGIAQQTFARGAKLRFEPDKQTGVSVDGAPPPATQRVKGAVLGGDEIIWDWPNGRLIIDAPNAKAYVGKFAGPYKFKDGIVLDKVSTSFVSFGMASADGRPLVGPGSSQRIDITAVADARNTNFQFKWDVQGGAVEMAKAIINRGRAPVLVDKVSYTLWFPTLLEGRFTEYDFALRAARETPVAGANRFSCESATPFMAVLTLSKRGADAAVPETATPVALVTPDEMATTKGAAAPQAEAAGPAGPWRPIPGIAWNMSYADAHKNLRASKLVCSSISPEDTSETPEKKITLSDAQLPNLWNTPADIEIAFSAGRAHAITATFKQPPPFVQAVTDLEKQFGAPTEKKEGAQFERSLARWDGAGKDQSVMMTESQGILKLLLTKK